MGAYKVILLFLFYLYSAFLPLTLNVSWLVSLSFEIELLLLFFMIIFYVRNTHISIANGVVITFFYLFYFLAPVLQLQTDHHNLVNTIVYNEKYVLYSNVLVILFILFYFICYLTLSNYNGKSGKISNLSGIFDNIKTSRLVGHVFIVLLFVSFFSALIATREALTKINELDFLIQDDQQFFVVIKGKIFYMLPFTVLMIFIFKYHNKFSTKHKLLFVVLLVFVLMSKNVIIDRRNALGPVYLSIVLLILPDKFKSNYNLLSLWFFVLVIMFPLTSILTHVEFKNWEDSFVTLNFLELFSNHFLDVNYDAWANISASIDFVVRNGHTLGSQVIGTVGFYIPRLFWLTKPVSTGELIGNFLMATQNMWFNNLSATTVLEGYIDFGIFGVILYSLLLAVGVYKLDQFLSSKSLFKRIFSVYASIFLFFLLRGALLPAIAYLTGAFVAIVVIPTALLRLFQTFSHRKKMG
jgi:hypothetical protein